MLRRTRAVPAKAVAVAVAITLAASLVACGGSGGASSPGANALVLYNAQHEDLMKLMVDGFTKATGIAVSVRDGSDFELANQINQEGSRSPADVFVTENSPAMALVNQGGNFAKLDPATLAQVPARYRPSDGSWVGFAARTTVLVYAKAKVDAGTLPGSILDLAGPAWAGRVGIAPAGADFQAIVSAVLALNGEDKTLAWLRGLKANAKTYRSNVAIMQAVNRGEIDAGVIYHYYWFKDQAESGANSDATALHYFRGGDAGGFVSVSGAGVLKSSRRAADAQKLVAYLASPAGQQILAKSSALEYPVGNGAAAAPALTPLAELDPPAVDLGSLNGLTTVSLMQEAGLL
ncbi:MAG TPA: iron ABC transporter substrate-binding protein [Dermatophilaceae bacterium]|nr:iron ABC transporter substrate-binding protein [Dermatophilaceae bacterium]